MARGPQARQRHARARRLRARCPRIGGSSRAKKGVRAFLDQAARNDRIGLMRFSDKDEIRTVVPLGTGPRAPQEARVGGRRAHRLRRHRLLRRRVQGVRARCSASRTTERASTRWCCSPTATTRTPTCTSPSVVEQLDQGDTEYPVRVFTIAYKLRVERRPQGAQGHRRGVRRRLLPGRHRRHRDGLPQDRLVLLRHDDAAARHPRGPAQGARGQRAHEAA